eukprot:1992293-Rhodomonas_salina.1
MRGNSEKKNSRQSGTALYRARMHALMHQTPMQALVWLMQCSAVLTPPLRFRVPGLKQNCNVLCSLTKLLRHYKKNSSWTRYLVFRTLYPYQQWY